MKESFRFINRSKSMRSVFNHDQVETLNSPRDLNSSVFHLIELKRFCDILQIQRQKDKAIKQQQKREHLKNLMAKKFRLIYNVIRLLHHHERVILEKHDEEKKKKPRYLLHPVIINSLVRKTQPKRSGIQYLFLRICRQQYIFPSEQHSSMKALLEYFILTYLTIQYTVIPLSIIVADIIFILRSCYFNRQNVLISNQWLIFLNYLKGWLIFDILGLMPMGYMFNVTIQYNKFPRFIRVFRINKIFKGSNFHENNGLLGKVFNIFNSYQINIVRVVIRFIYGLHLFACLWHFASNAEQDSFEQDDFDHQGSQYISSLVWSLQTFSTIGYGNDPAHNPAQFIIAILWMVLGASFYCVVLINLSEWLKKLNTEQAYVEIQNNLKTFFHKVQVIKEVQDRIYQYLTLNFNSNQTWSLSLQEWFQDLPNNSQKEITLYVTYFQMMQIHFLRLNLNFSVSILPKMMLMRTNPNSKIWIKEEFVNEIFFLIKGKLQYRTQFGKVLLLVNEGQIFGEQEFFKKLKYSKQYFRKDYAVAIELCEYIVLNADFFFQQLQHYPALFQYLGIIAQNREQEMKAHIIENQLQREKEIMNNIKLEQIKETCNIDVIRYKGMMKPQRSIIYETQHNRTQQILEQLIHCKRHRVEKLRERFRKVVQMIIFANNLIDKPQLNTSRVHPMMLLHQQQQQTQTTLKTTSNESRIQINSGFSKLAFDSNIKKIQKSIIIKMKQCSNKSYRRRKSLFSKKIWVHKYQSKEVMRQIFRVKNQTFIRSSFQDSIIEIDDFSHYEKLLSIFENNFEKLKEYKKLIKETKFQIDELMNEMEDEIESVSNWIEKIELNS